MPNQRDPDKVRLPYVPRELRDRFATAAALRGETVTAAIVRCMQHDSEDNRAGRK